MITSVALGLGCAGLAAAWCVAINRRRRRLPVHVGTDALPPEISRKCDTYLTGRGLDVRRVGRAHVFDLEITPQQFNGKIDPIRISCRSGDYITGQSFFNDVRGHVASKPNLQRIWVLSTSPVTAEMKLQAAKSGIPVMHLSELEPLATALLRVKERAPDALDFDGVSPDLKSFLLAKIDADRTLALRREAAQQAELRKDWVDAEDQWRACIAQGPKDWRAQRALATALVAQSKLSEAEQLLQRAVMEFPNEARLFEKPLSELRQARAGVTVERSDPTPGGGFA